MFFDVIGSFNFNWDFAVSFLSIILINIILSGDNAVVIAMAVRSLSPKQRKRGIIIGAGVAVILRIGLTFFATQLLEFSFVKLFGGIVILWIAVKLFMEGAPEDKFRKESKTLGQAVVTIMLADIIMSTDNILAIAGASKGSVSLLIFGLGLSIPLVVFTSNFLSKLIDRYPFVIYIGAAILGRVGGEMIVTDPYVNRIFQPSNMTGYILQACLAAGVIATGKLWMKLRAMRQVPVQQAENVGPFFLVNWDLR